MQTRFDEGATSTLSPDGRCRAFDAAANGTVRGEGGAMLVLKPLTAAVAAGDRIAAIIRRRTRGVTSGPNPAEVPTLSKYRSSS